MVFKTNIPQPSDFLSDSQADLLNNNIALDSVYGRNHRNFSDTTGSSGKHKFVEMVRTTTVPPLQTEPLPMPPNGLSGATGTIYTKLITKSGTACDDMYYTNDNTSRRYQVTNVAPNTNVYDKCGVLTADNSPTNTRYSGWTWMGQAVIMQYGYVLKGQFTPVVGVGGTVTVFFPFQFDVEPYIIQLTPYDSEAGSASAEYLCKVCDPSRAGFTMNYDNTSTDFLTKITWMAIGPYSGAP